MADRQTGRRKCLQGAAMINWVQEIAGWAPIAFAWFATAAIGTAIHFFPMARLLDSLSG
jgi:hypothetical protein